MALEFTICPVCKQKLGVYDYMTTGTEVVCANLKCETTIRIEAHNPLRVTVVPIEQTHNADSQPESYS